LESSIVSRCGSRASNGGTITEYVPCKILEVDPPLVKIGDGSGTNMIVNTASQAFVSASEVP
jgi:hypothetical protein